jgi:hypothetical protein
MRVVMKKGAPTPVRESGAPLLVAILYKVSPFTHGVLNSIFLCSAVFIPRFKKQFSGG